MEYDTCTRERVPGGWMITWRSDVILLAIESVQDAILECEKHGNNELKAYLEADLIKKEKLLSNIIRHVEKGE